MTGPMRVLWGERGGTLVMMKARCCQSEASSCLILIGQLWVWQTGGWFNHLSIIFESSSPFSDVFSGLSLRWTCEINPEVLWSILFGCYWIGLKIRTVLISCVVVEWCAVIGWLAVWLRPLCVFSIFSCIIYSFLKPKSSLVKLKSCFTSERLIFRRSPSVVT